MSRRDDCSLEKLVCSGAVLTPACATTNKDPKEMNYICGSVVMWTLRSRV